MAVASPESLRILVQSRALIPALISCLNICTTVVWEADEDSFSDDSLSRWDTASRFKWLSEQSFSLLQIMQGSLQLLHFVVFKSDSPVDLQSKLQYSPQQFNGAEHMFVVALGRLSYADPPELYNKVAKGPFEKCAGGIFVFPKNVIDLNSAELARDLLEDVVDGPEVDTIWGAFVWK